MIILLGSWRPSQLPRRKHSKTSISDSLSLLNNSNFIELFHAGFYRVNYDTDNWDALIKQLNDTPSDIHLLNRAQLIDDSFALAQAGQLNYSVALSLSKYLKKEDSVIPWYSAKNSLSYLIERMSRDEQTYANIKVHKK